MPEQRLPELIMELIPIERKQKGRPKKTWMKGVQEAMMSEGWRQINGWTKRNGVVSGRQRKMS